jgi:hypothetical protein
MSHEIIPASVGSVPGAPSEALAKAMAPLPDLTEAELHLLNHLVVDRLRWIQESRRVQHMAKYYVGDRVCFHDRDGVHIEGRILRLNTKTVSIVTDDDHHWKVAPGFLRLVKSVLDRS